MSETLTLPKTPRIPCSHFLLRTDQLFTLPSLWLSLQFLFSFLWRIRVCGRPTWKIWNNRSHASPSPPQFQALGHISLHFWVLWERFLLSDDHRVHIIFCVCFSEITKALRQHFCYSTPTANFLFMLSELLLAHMKFLSQYKTFFSSSKQGYLHLLNSVNKQMDFQVSFK